MFSLKTEIFTVVSIVPGCSVLEYSAEVAYRGFHIAHEQNLETRIRRNVGKCSDRNEELKSYYLGFKAYIGDSLSYLDLLSVFFRIMYSHLTLSWH